MSPSSAELVQRNQEYAKTHKPFPTISEIQATGGEAPKTCIVTCVDPRVFPEQLFKLKFGEAFIFRTIGGHPMPVFEHIIGLDVTSHGFENLILLYHTDCGSQYFDEPHIHSTLLRSDATAKVGEMDFGTMKSSVEQSLREDLGWLKKQPLMSQNLKAGIRGYIYDLKTGELHEIS